MITYRETLIAMADVPDHLASRPMIGPATAKQLRPQPAGVYRWAKHGVRGHRLETTLINNRMFTSVEALDRFFDRCAGSPAVKPPPPKSRGMTPEEIKRLIP